MELGNLSPTEMTAEILGVVYERGRTVRFE